MIKMSAHITSKINFFIIYINRDTLVGYIGLKQLLNSACKLHFHLGTLSSVTGIAAVLQLQH